MVGEITIRNGVRKRDDIVFFLIGFAILILLNYIFSFVFYRVDLTSEKRYSLSTPSKNLLRQLDDVVFFKVYLEGEFPANFKRLRNETLEMLNEFRAYTGNQTIAYEFINPSKSNDEEVRNEIYRQLYKQGLRPTDLEIKGEDGISNKIIWPGAIVSYKGREVAVDLLESRLGAGPEEVLNSSIENLEYALSNSILKLTKPIKPSIAFIEGHGELNEYETADIARTLSEYYDVKRIRLDEQLNRLTARRASMEDSSKIQVFNKFDLIIIARPDSAFSEKDKFIIDQFLMYGGRIFWLIDPVAAEMDSLTKSDLTMGLTRDLNLGDQLFTYGIRLNDDLILDVQSAKIPLPVGMLGNQPKYELFPWFYFPLLNPTPGQPIVNNLNVVKGEFCSSIDLIQSDSVKKEVLLSTSPYTKLAHAPVRISLGITRFEPKREQFDKANLPVAVLLEGHFRSVFKDRLTSNFLSGKSVKFREYSALTKMIVVSDGDVIRNHVRKDGRIMPLGIDRFTGQEYGNNDFIVNSVNFLCGEDELMVTRSRSLKIRLLDKTRAVDKKLNYQVFNMAAPILIVLIFAIAFTRFRKKKNTVGP